MLSGQQTEQVSNLCRAFLRRVRQLEEGLPRCTAAGPSTGHSWVTTSIVGEPQCPATVEESLRKAQCVGSYKISTGFIFLGECSYFAMKYSQVLFKMHFQYPPN